jgi:tripartite-type tricarboxylate transporter receptor subunit TctC
LAQAYPGKPIRVIAPASPGGSCDALPRLAARKVEGRLGRQLPTRDRLARDIGFKPR